MELNSRFYFEMIFIFLNFFQHFLSVSSDDKKFFKKIVKILFLNLIIFIFHLIYFNIILISENSILFVIQARVTDQVSDALVIKQSQFFTLKRVYFAYINFIFFNQLFFSQIYILAPIIRIFYFFVFGARIFIFICFILFVA